MTPREEELQGYAHCTVERVENVQANMHSLGMRYVSEKEDKMRWEDARVLTLYQLQDGMHIHAGGEETKSSQRVCLIWQFVAYSTLT